jgi:hypothetical protein
MHLDHPNNRNVIGGTLIPSLVRDQTGLKLRHFLILLHTPPELSNQRNGDGSPDFARGSHHGSGAMLSTNLLSARRIRVPATAGTRQYRDSDSQAQM